MSNGKGFFIFFDDKKEECMAFEIDAGQIEMKEEKTDLKIGEDGILLIPQVPITIKINPINIKGEYNYSWMSLFRTRRGGKPIFGDDDEIMYTTPIEYTETKEEYLKREKEYIKKLIRRK